MDELDRIIAERSADPCYEDWTKLHHACNLGLLGCIKTILADGINVNVRTRFTRCTPLYIICCNPRSLECLEVLLAAGADVNLTSVNGWTPLHAACKSGISKDYIVVLLAAGADVNAQTSAGWTPLLFACYGGHMQLVQLLLEAGADPSVRNYFGDLPQNATYDIRIKDLVNNFGLGGGCSTKEAV